MVKYLYFCGLVVNNPFAEYNLNTILMDKKLFTRGGQPYEAPLVKTLEVMSEGVLCGSFDSADYGYDNENNLGDI